MIKVLFAGENEMREVSFQRTSANIITLKGITDAPTKGFTTWRMDGITQLGDFSEFTTVYRAFDDAVQYSDDGSVWVEPSYPPQEEDKPTQEERITALEAQLAAYEAAYAQGVTEGWA